MIVSLFIYGKIHFKDRAGRHAKVDIGVLFFIVLFAWISNFFNMRYIWILVRNPAEGVLIRGLICAVVLIASNGLMVRSGFTQYLTDKNEE